ncbi:MAG: mycofactocin precursor [Acidimicrobiaceae bacterium]|nr:mycofactocin precursor [Acidimicrobiaceae bacterium]
MSIAEVHEQPSLDTNAAETETDEVEDELLVEEISIDGMCGVY